MEVDEWALTLTLRRLRMLTPELENPETDEAGALGALRLRAQSFVLALYNE